MNTTSAPIVAVALGLAAVVLSSCGSAGSGDDAAPDRSHDPASVTERAPAYVGGTWEARFRDQFWQNQHIHDSWNPCHIGENVPKELQGSGPACWARLKSQTGR
jgi:hypothetical protein